MRREFNDILLLLINLSINNKVQLIIIRITKKEIEKENARK